MTVAFPQTMRLSQLLLKATYLRLATQAEPTPNFEVSKTLKSGEKSLVESAHCIQMNDASGSNYGFWLGYSYSGKLLLPGVFLCIGTSGVEFLHVVDNIIRGNTIDYSKSAAIAIEHGQSNIIEGIAPTEDTTFTKLKILRSIPSHSASISLRQAISSEMVM